MSKVEQLVEAWAKRTPGVKMGKKWTQEEMDAFAERMRKATEEQFKKDDEAMRKSWIAARFHMLD